MTLITALFSWALASCNGLTWQRKIPANTDPDKAEPENRSLMSTEEHKSMLENWVKCGCYSFNDLKTLSSAASAACLPPPKVKYIREQKSKLEKKKKRQKMLAAKQQQ